MTDETKERTRPHFVRIPPPLYQELRELAELEERSVASLVRLAVRRELHERAARLPEVRA